MKLKTFTTEQEWIQVSVAFFENVVNEFNNAMVVFSGGNTPIPVYEAIAKHAHIHHNSVEANQADERYVPGDHPDSNKHLLNKHLIHPANERAKAVGKYSPFCCFGFFRTDLPIEKAIKDYQRQMEHAMFPIDRFRLAILGLGTDGHTASLFPHSSALHETEHLVAHTTTDSGPVHDRLTLTFPAIMSAAHLLLLVRGKDKKAILDDLLHSDKTIDELPAKKLLEHTDLTIHYLET